MNVSKDTNEPWLALEGERGLVSVVIPTYNRAAILRETLDAFWKQTYRPIQLIVVDDGSSDETVDFMEGVVASPPSGCQVSFHQQDHQGGPAARNHGAQFATGEYLVFMDDDDIPVPTFLETRVTALEADSYVNLAHSVWQVFMQDESGYQILAARGAYPKNQTSPWYAFLHNWELLLQGCVMRRELISRVGPWKTDLHKSQDLDYKVRILAQPDCKPVEVNGAPVFYRKHAASISGNLSEDKLNSHETVIAMIEALCVARTDYEEHRIVVANYLWTHAFWFYGEGAAAHGYRVMQRAKTHDPDICRRKGTTALALDALGLDHAIGPGYRMISRLKRTLGLSRTCVVKTLASLPHDIVSQD